MDLRSINELTDRENFSKASERLNLLFVIGGLLCFVLTAACQGTPQVQPAKELELNEQNVVVDYHLLDQPTLEHRFVRGTIAQNLPSAITEP